jgi:hypothetical protein
MHAFDISEPLREPPELWSLDSARASSRRPSVLDGMIWVGTRGGGVYGSRTARLSAAQLKKAKTCATLVEAGSRADRRSS